MDRKRRKISSLRKGVTKKPASSASASLDSMDPEDREIQRLERLLGIDKKKALRTKLAAKLDDEYDKFEGIGGGFGSFLLDLDDLTQRISSSSKGRKRAGEEADDDNEEDVPPSNMDEELEDEEGEEAEDVDGEEEDIEGEDEAEEGDEEVDGDEEGEGEEGEEEEVEEDDEDEETKAKKLEAAKAEAENAKFTYKPTQGEDIYGRVIDASKANAGATAKYVPPARRNVISMNPTSEKEILLKRKITNIVNKLSEVNKDALLRELKQLYDTHSHLLCTTYLYHTLLEMVIHSSQRLSTQIALYTSVLAGLYYSVGQEIVYEGLEIVFKKLHEEYLVKVMVYYQQQQQQQQQQGNKSSGSDDEDIRLKYHRPIYNLLLFFLYLYNYRILFHGFFIEMINMLINPMDFALFLPSPRATEGSGAITTIAPLTPNNQGTTGYGAIVEAGILEIRLEMLEAILSHGMEYLRHDEPSILQKLSQDMFKLSQYSQKHLVTNTSSTNGDGNTKTIVQENTIVKITHFQNTSHATSSQPAQTAYTRLTYLSEYLQTMIRNPVHHQSSGPVVAMVVTTRKWLGTVKRLLGNVTNDLLIRVKVMDLLLLEVQGRWWKTGASWIGRQQNQAAGGTGGSSTGSLDNDLALSTSIQSPETEEEKQFQEQINKLAKKLHCHTPVRKAILTQIMLSNDISTTYENLIKLSLKGKHDREIIKVLMECAIHEKAYNKYYTELIELFLQYDRQFKITCQYTVWDLMKYLHEEGISLAGQYLQEEDSEMIMNAVEELEADDSFMSLKEMQLLSRKALNLGRIVGEFVKNIHLPMSAVMKPTDVTNLHMVDKLFLSTFFFTLFHFSATELSDESFQLICDRVATSKDYSSIRDNILYFLQTHMQELPTKGLKPEQVNLVKQRKKVLIKTMKEMDILDYRPGGNRKVDDEFDDGGKRQNKRKNKNRNNLFYPENLPADFDEL